MLDEFSAAWLAESPCFTVHGYSPYLRTKNILAAIFHGVLKTCTASVSATGTELETAVLFNSLLHKYGKRVYLVVHSLDVWVESDPCVWAVLSALTKPPAAVHLLASIESSLVPMELRQGLRSHIYIATHTYRPYDAEALVDPKRRGGATFVAIDGAIHTLEAVGHNVKEMFLHLCRFVLDSPNGAKRYEDYLEDCRSSSWANNVTSFETKLEELSSHQLLRVHKSATGMKTVAPVPDPDTLRQIVSHFKGQESAASDED